MLARAPASPTLRLENLPSGPTSAQRPTCSQPGARESTTVRLTMRASLLSVGTSCLVNAGSIPGVHPWPGGQTPTTRVSVNRVGVDG